MAYWFYYTVNGQKQGAVTEEQLKELAKAGKITPGTMLEHQSGDKTIAAEVKWLTFGEPAQNQTSTPTTPVEPTPFTASSTPANRTIPQNTTKKGSVKKGCLGCGVILFVLFLIGLIAGPSPEERERRQKEREQQRAEQRERQAEREQQRAEQRQQTEHEQLKKKIERECSTMFSRILDEYYKDEFTMSQRMSMFSKVVNVTRLDDNGYALIHARIEVDAPASLQRPGEPRVKKRGGATFERKSDGRYFITRVTLDNGDLRFVESQYLKGREIKLNGAEIILGDVE